MLDKLNYKVLWLSFLLPGILFPLRIAFAVGGIATDGTVGPAQTLSGASVTIPQNLGKTVGKNLFHSFNQFNVNNGQTVTFTENVPHALDNVISRVTGGSPSAIDGTLRSTPGGHANLYLVNPSGVMFGQNARIDVPGAFHASTADEVRFQDGAKFSASQPTGSTLTAAAPASFGFLSTSSATNGLLKVDGSQLAVKTGQKLDMIGRNINVDHRATLSAPSGEVRLEATGQGSANIPLNQSLEAAHGTLALTESTIDASGEGGGKIIIRGSDLKMDQGAKILADTNGKKDGSKIDVRLTGDMDMKSGGIISASTFGSGSAGNIIINAKNLSIDGQTTNLNGQKTYVPTRISSTAGSGETADKKIGNAGNITVDIADHLSLIGGGQINASSFSTGDAGRITVNAGQLLIDGQDALLLRDNLGSSVQTGIFAAAAKNWSGKGGNIAVTVGDDMNMKSGGVISVSTHGSRAAGNIRVSASDLTIDGRTANGQTDTAISTIAGEGKTVNERTGNAGNITVDIANRLSVIRGGRIISSTFGSGHAGEISVSAGQLLIDGEGALTDSFLGGSLQTGIFTAAERASSGKGGNITVAVQNDIRMQSGGKISVSTNGLQAAGDIVVTSQGDINIRDGSEILASTHGNGAAGNLHVKAKNLSVDGQTILNGKKSYLPTRIASTAGSGDTLGERTGNSGNITVDIADRLSLVGGGQIGASSFSTGDAGSVTVNAGQLLIDGQDALLFRDSSGVPVQTGVFTAAGRAWSGKGNDLTVTVQGDINMKNGGVIGASTHGRGVAGNVRISASDLTIDGRTANGQTDTAISTIAGEGKTVNERTGNAGNITVDIANRLSVIRGGRIISSTFGSGHAGEISVSAGQLLIDGEGALTDSFLGGSLQTGIFTAAERAWSGRGNDLTVAIKGDMDMTGSGQISASTRGSQAAGNISITAKNLKMDNDSEINVSTGGAGKAGDVMVGTGTLFMNNGSRITAEALTDSRGGIGNVRITANDSIVLSNQSKISIENAGSAIISQQSSAGNLSASDTSLFISAPNIFLNNSQITTNSTKNINAGAIQVNFSRRLFLDRESFVSTEANNGNGGNIDIWGGQLIQLINSGFKTSVHGLQNGNGGNINVNAESLVMETGLIQANTAAPHASGGDITLNLNGLIPSGGSLIEGGDEPIDWQPDVFGFNVIQAAAPNGISGHIQSTAPQLDLSGVLSNLGGPQFDTSAISQDYCSLGTGSSLIRQGKGGLLPRSRDSVMY
ncbi:two-partner secretion domain-containing protein [Methylobacter luteus]|jgi:filamentous hemagglutinin family protein|uniref:two-partner secretion domain-containing protein n=1 Tax=Methylobacter luteus TaxID=415 RepID=UPI0003F8D2EF|nr:filamentous hemagglutinin N-terminal domain-containing protein [Methylobacter luteus]